jgi:hypothetical protein
MSRLSLWPDRHSLLDSLGEGDWRLDGDERCAHLVPSDGSLPVCGLPLEALGLRAGSIDAKERDVVAFCPTCWAEVCRLNVAHALERRLLFELIDQDEGLSEKELGQRTASSDKDVQKALAALAARELIDRDAVVRLAGPAEGNPRRSVRNLWRHGRELDRDARIGAPQRIRGLLLDHDRPMTAREVSLRLPEPVQDPERELEQLSRDRELRIVGSDPQGYELTSRGRESARAARAKRRPQQKELDALRRLLEDHDTWQRAPEAQDRGTAFPAWSARVASLAIAKRKLLDLARPSWIWIAGLRERSRAQAGEPVEFVDPLLADHEHVLGGSNSSIPLEGGALEALARCATWCRGHVARALADVDLARQSTERRDDRDRLSKADQGTREKIAAELEKRAGFSRGSDLRREVLAAALRFATASVGGAMLSSDRSNLQKTLDKLAEKKLLECSGAEGSRKWRLSDEAVAFAVQLLDDAN